MRNIDLISRSLVSRGVQIKKCDAPSRSHFGGVPRLPSAVEWPHWHNRKLSFLARISLSDLHRQLRVSWLPAEGALLFFYDLFDQPWGYDPSHKGGSRVLHVPDLDEAVPASSACFDDDGLNQVNLVFQSVDTLPSVDREQVRSLSLSESEMAVYERIRDAQNCGLPKHQMAGLPTPIQSDDMELQCQLTSSGLPCGDEDDWRHPRVAQLAPGRADWQLLLQMDTDEDIGVMWGDCGMVYFWVRAHEAAAGRFDDTWAVLQCG